MCRLHGVEVDEHYLEVYPLRAMKGKAQVLDVSNWTLLDTDSRATRLSFLEYCSELYPDPKETFDLQVLTFSMTASAQGGTEGPIDEQLKGTSIILTHVKRH